MAARLGGHVDSIAGATGGKTSLLPPGKRHRKLRQSRAAHPGEILIDQTNGLVLPA